MGGGRQTEGGSSRRTKEEVQSLHYVARTLLAGGVAGCCAKTVIAPLDRIKILFQASNPHYQHLSGSFGGLLKALQRVSATEGLQGHFKGHSATLVRIFPYAALQYMSYEQLKMLLNVEGQKEKPYTRLLAGSCAGVISVFGTYPLDLIRAKLAFQVKMKRYRGLWHTLAKTFVKEGGIRGLYRGFVPTVAGIVPYAGVSFFCYDSLKAFFKSLTGKETLPATLGLAIGGFSGAIAQTASYPFDVVRRRMQVEGLQEDLAGTKSASPRVYTTTLGSMRHILKAEGLRGLYVGLSINYIKVAPAVGISFVTYEFLKKQLDIS